MKVVITVEVTYPDENTTIMTTLRSFLESEQLAGFVRSFTLEERTVQE